MCKLLYSLRQRGVMVLVNGSNLRIPDPRRLTPHDVDNLRKEKPVILQALQDELREIRRCLRLAVGGIGTQPLVEALERLFPGIEGVRVTSICRGKKVPWWPLRDFGGMPNGWWPDDTGLILHDGRELPTHSEPRARGQER